MYEIRKYGTSMGTRRLERPEVLEVDTEADRGERDTEGDRGERDTEGDRRASVSVSPPRPNREMFAAPPPLGRRREVTSGRVG
jgi:hypothetical protein